MGRNEASRGYEPGFPSFIPVEEQPAEETVQETPQEPEPAAAIPPDILQAFRAEIEALRSEVARLRSSGGEIKVDEGGVGGYPWMYWRRPVRPGDPLSGWITIGPGGATPRGARDTGSYNLYLKKGFQPITKYGYINPPSSEKGWYDFIHLIRQGGAHEFPVSQILAYRWHIHPPVPGVKFPQLEEVADAIQHAVCPQCDFDVWAPPDDASIGNRLFEHLWQVHGFDPEDAEEFVHKQGFTYVRQQITDEETVRRNVKAAERIKKKLGGGRG